MLQIIASDFSYAERAIIDVWIWLWFIQRVWTTDRFSCLRWSKLRNFDLKSVITLLIFLMLPLQAIFDVSWTYLTYNERFIVDPSTKRIYQRPPYYIDGNKVIPLWTNNDLLLKNITEYVLTIAFSFQIGTLALMQAFWSHLSSQMGGEPFMRSWKLNFYISWVIASMIIFPSTRLLTSHNEILAENIPTLIFSAQLLLIIFLGIKNRRRLNDLLDSIKQSNSSSGQETTLRIHYFIEMNNSLIIGALLISVGCSVFAIIEVLYKKSIDSKLLMDMLIIHTNFGSLILWVTMILIIYPRYYITGLSGKSNSMDYYYNDQRRLSSLEIGDKRILISSTTTTTTTTMTTSQPSPVKKSPSYKRSISSILEEQKQQIETFRHKTSMSTSSIATATTITSNHTLLSQPPTSPLSTTSINAASFY